LDPPTNQPVDVVAEKLVGGGRAIAHHDGATWMVAGALPGEQVRAEATGRRAGIVEARTLEVLSEPHPARLREPCPQTGVCGGCDWPHVALADGARLKTEAAAEAARSFPDLAQRITSAPIHQSENGYRLRARLHWDGARKLLGFYRQRSREVVSIAPCRILTPRLMRALPALADALAESCGELADVEWLEGSAAGDAVAALRPAKGSQSPIDPAWIPESEIVGPVVSGFHRLSAAGRVRPCWGATEVRINLPIPLDVPIGSFFQANRHLIGPLFERVAQLVGGEGTPVFDLHAHSARAVAVPGAGGRIHRHRGPISGRGSRSPCPAMVCRVSPPVKPSAGAGPPGRRSTRTRSR
jgi:23S rRNA (uracil1939-C5)-methyltransferase